MESWDGFVTAWGWGVRPVRALLTTLRHEIRGRMGRRVHFVSDSANWSFKWDAHYLAKGLGKRLKQEVPIITAPWSLRHQIILFGNRYAYFFGPRERLHPSNDLFLIWFHGEPDSNNPRMQQLFDQLPGAVERVRKVIVSCTISRRVLLEQGVPGEKILLIPLGVDLQRFQPPDGATRTRMRAELGIPEGAFCIGSFQKDGDGWGEGNEPKWVKGPDLFLEVMARVKGSHPGLMVLLTGPARGFVKNGLDRLGIPWRHRLLEDYQEIVGCYQALDLYLIASRVEGGPKALMESWACGVPLVSTRMGMPADWILHGENGLLAEVDDAPALAAHVAALMEDPALSAQCRRGGLETVQGLDWQWVADQYYAALSDCMVR
ncbi:MAG: glycosyltransferase family 4 protein [Magnetococcales bacterium]|nr:glycosyltransferase family 4 protein [Magnetococcales bacterium]